MIGALMAIASAGMTLYWTNAVAEKASQDDQPSQSAGTELPPYTAPAMPGQSAESKLPGMAAGSAAASAPSPLVPAPAPAPMPAPAPALVVQQFDAATGGYTPLPAVVARRQKGAAMVELVFIEGAKLAPGARLCVFVQAEA